MKEGWFGTRQKQSLVVFVFMLAGIAYVSYKNQPEDTPEAAATKIVNTLIEAAEEKNLGPFKTYLSERVKDENGNGKEELLNTLRGIFFAHKKISITLMSLEVATGTNPNIVDADIVVLMSERILPTDRGEFFVSMRLEEDGWRIREVKWGDGYGAP